MKPQRNRLESVLLKLEDYLFNFRIAVNDMAIHKLLPTTASLRESLRSGDHAKMNAVSDLLFDIREMADPGIWNCIDFIQHYYSCLVDWHVYSQRVYAPSSNLVNMLQFTDLPDFPPEEIRFLANSFAIQLPEPIIIPGSIREHDFLLFNKKPNSKCIVVTSFPPHYDNYVPFTVTEKQKYSKKSVDGKITALIRMSKRLEKNVNSENGIFSYSLDVDDGETYKGLIGRMTEEHQPELEFFYKMIIGLNLYLQSNRKKDSERKVDIPLVRHGRGESITNGMQLFELETSRIIPVRPSSGDGESGIQVPYHFRNAFWRRPKGFGKIDDAERSEWVTWTWVREDRKEEGVHSGKLRPVEMIEGC